MIYWIEELVVSMPLIATALMLMWPEKRYPQTPMHLRKQPPPLERKPQ